MCKRNALERKKEKKKASTGCVRETPHDKNEASARTCKRNKHRMCKKTSPKKKPAWDPCKRNSRIKITEAWDV